MKIYKTYPSDKQVESDSSPPPRRKKSAHLVGECALSQIFYPSNANARLSGSSFSLPYINPSRCAQALLGQVLPAGLEALACKLAQKSLESVARCTFFLAR